MCSRQPNLLLLPRGRRRQGRRLHIYIYIYIYIYIERERERERERYLSERVCVEVNEGFCSFIVFDLLLFLIVV